jgi:hypothetical protein
VIPCDSVSQLDALLRTLAIEAPVALVCLWIATRRDPTRAPWWRMVLVVVGCSLITHPLAWWTNRGLVDQFEFATRATIIEAAVVIVEAVILRGGLLVRWWIAIVTSFAMNMASFGFGLWLRA